MTCKEAAEFVSALYDGETIPRAAAEHVGECEACQARLKSYMEMGAELRRVASLEIPEEAIPRVWDKPQRRLTMWWQKGWQTMRIPRLAFALMVAGIVALGSSLAVVGVRARSEGTVVLLKITHQAGGSKGSNSCPLSTVDRKWITCAGTSRVDGGSVAYEFRLLSKDGNRIQLGLRSKFDPSGSGTYSLSAFDNLPERQYWFEPGETLQVDVAGLGPLALTGEWMDHVPVLGGMNINLDPGPEELRVVSPLLVKDNKVVGDYEGASASTDNTSGSGVVIYMPGQGRFTVSSSPIAGAVAGRARLNRITFESDGHSYAFLTGAPVTRGEQVWILHDANYKPAGKSAESAFIGSGSLSQLASNGGLGKD